MNKYFRDCYAINNHCKPSTVRVNSYYNWDVVIKCEVWVPLLTSTLLQYLLRFYIYINRSFFAICNL